MCWKCDHPKATEEEWLEAIHELVVEHGWAVQFVESNRAPHAYTVGLHAGGLPELLVTGLAAEPATGVLNAVAAYLVAGGRPVPGEWIAITNGPTLAVVRVEHPDGHINMVVVVVFYGNDVQALQLVWAGDSGHRPWCPEFSNGQVRQPVLGVLPELSA